MEWRNKPQISAISIHALLAESDAPAARMLILGGNFYPRSPCGERQTSRCLSRPVHTFLSTLSLRRATPNNHQYQHNGGHFYPRSPCGERQAVCNQLLFDTMISIHALLAESDVKYCLHVHTPPIFLSTLSLRRATVLHFPPADGNFNFYPRSPCGERHSLIAITPSNFSFLSTLSLRRATFFFILSPVSAPCISIHALLAESDQLSLQRLSISSLFLSTLSLRRATIRGIVLKR